MSNVTALPLVEASTQEPTGFEDIPAIMSPKTLASVLETTPLTLQRWRDRREGPRWSQFPNSNVIRYTRVDVLSWLAAHQIEVTA